METPWDALENAAYRAVRNANPLDKYFSSSSVSGNSSSSGSQSLPHQHVSSSSGFRYLLTSDDQPCAYWRACFGVEKLEPPRRQTLEAAAQRVGLPKLMTKNDSDNHNSYREKALLNENIVISGVGARVAYCRVRGFLELVDVKPKESKPHSQAMHMSKQHFPLNQKHPKLSTSSFTRRAVL